MLKPFPEEVLEPTEQIIASRSHHHDNLTLRLIHCSELDVFRIQVYRHNDRSSHDLWGVWLVGEGDDRAEIQLAAIRKFNLISL